MRGEATWRPWTYMGNHSYHLHSGIDIELHSNRKPNYSYSKINKRITTSWVREDQEDIFNNSSNAAFGCLHGHIILWEISAIGHREALVRRSDVGPRVTYEHYKKMILPSPEHQKSPPLCIGLGQPWWRGQAGCPPCRQHSLSVHWGQRPQLPGPWKHKSSPVWLSVLVVTIHWIGTLYSVTTRSWWSPTKEGPSSWLCM